MTDPEIGEEVSLDVEQRKDVGQDDSLLVTGVILAKKPHYDNPSRMMYYFSCLKIGRQRGDDVSTAVLEIIGSNRRNDLKKNSATLVSAEGYVYRLDGWYDDQLLRKLVLRSSAKKQTIDSETIAEMVDKARKEMDSYCELCYLFFATRPWFEVDFTVLGAVTAPDSTWAYSAYACHRCLQPFLMKERLEEHLNAYCEQKSPPGAVIYMNRVSIGPSRTAEVRIRYVDGAKNIQYCRRLALLSKSFVESKVLTNDVDIFEFFTITISRSIIAEFSGFDERISKICCAFEAEEWNGELVAGYFCRIKHQPDHCLSCITVFPPFQGRGLGNLMICVAYGITFIRQTECGCAKKCGSRGGKVSKPWSFMGQRALFSYWRQELNKIINKFDGQEINSIETLAKSIPGVHADDLSAFLIDQRHAFSTPVTLSDEEYALRSIEGTLPPRRADAFSIAEAFQGANTAPGPNPKAQLGLLLFDGDDEGDEDPQLSDGSVSDPLRRLVLFDVSHFATRGDNQREYGRSLYHYT